MFVDAGMGGPEHKWLIINLNKNIIPRITGLIINGSL